MQTNRIKTFAVLLAIFLGSVFLQAQDITGQWNGVLSIQGMNLRLVFHISENAGVFSATMDSPDQGAFGIPVNLTTFDGSKLSLAIPAMGLSYEGELNENTVSGTFKQGHLTLPLTLERTEEPPKALVRPQEPKQPFPYRSEEVFFENRMANITLAGTLTLPENGENLTAVILISGSGAQNRDSEIFGHKPFLVIADYLTRRGIAVLRFDDRGTAQSTGNFETATTANFATDVESAIAFLKTHPEINLQKIGLIGHSEGGIIAPMVASRSQDVAFIVMLAGTALRGDKILLSQQAMIFRASGMPENQIEQILAINTKIFDKIIDTKADLSQQEIINFLNGMKVELTVLAAMNGMTTDDYIHLMSAQLSSLWMQYFIRYNPAPALEKLQIPVFALNGSNDLQVSATENLTAISEALKRGGNQNVIIREYSGLNHLFQECASGLPQNYGLIEQTFSPKVLMDLADWILSLQITN